MKRPALVTTDPNGSPRCSKCRALLLTGMPDFCPNCKRELDYSAFMIKSKLNEIKRKKESNEPIGKQS